MTMQNPDRTVTKEDLHEFYNDIKPYLGGGGGGGGASALEDLTDVAIETPSDGQVLKYDATNDEWVNGDDEGTTYTAGDGIEIDENNEVSVKEMAAADMSEIVSPKPQVKNQTVELYHNIPRLYPKDITEYMTDGSFWKRLNGTDGYTLFQDIYVGDYFQMSRAITAPNQDAQYATTGSDYITIAGINTRMGDGDAGDNIPIIDYNHVVCVPGQGFGGVQNFGKKRMNSSNVTTGGYVGSEMHTTTIGAVVSAGSTASGATINQQLYAEFGTHLKTTRELLSNAVDGERYNRFGQKGGATSNWAWTTCQAVLMSEIEVYGSIVFSSSGQDTGNANKQMPLFVHNKQAMNNRSATYWLKDVASSANFCLCTSAGSSNPSPASYTYNAVRPRFILA